MSTSGSSSNGNDGGSGSNSGSSSSGTSGGSSGSSTSSGDSDYERTPFYKNARNSQQILGDHWQLEVSASYGDEDPIQQIRSNLQAAHLSSVSDDSQRQHGEGQFSSGFGDISQERPESVGMTDRSKTPTPSPGEAVPDHLRVSNQTSTSHLSEIQESSSLLGLDFALDATSSSASYGLGASGGCLHGTYTENTSSYLTGEDSGSLFGSSLSPAYSPSSYPESSNLSDYLYSDNTFSFSSSTGPSSYSSSGANDSYSRY
ncbi:hypothetical protein V8F06_002307 [Rhypophila decipiens]